MPQITLDNFLLFMFFVVPGIIAMQTYAMKCPGQKKDIANSITEAMTYSAINLAFWSWWVYPLVTTPFATVNKLQLYFALVVVCIISPVGLALLWYWMRTTWLHSWLAMDHPTARAWDHPRNTRNAGISYI